MQDLQSYDYLFKIILVGDQKVGKSSLLTRYTRELFDVNIQSTIGVEFASKMLHYNGKDIKIQIWDTAGQEKYRCVTNTYYNGSCGALLVYDISDRTSFENIQKWYEEIQQNSVSNYIVLMLVGNKSDLSQNRAVSKEEGAEWAQKNKMGFIETSAKYGTNIEYTFQKLTETIVDLKEKIEIKKSEQKDKSIQENLQTETKSITNNSRLKNSKIKKKRRCWPFRF